MAKYEFRNVEYDVWSSGGIIKVHVHIRSIDEPYRWFFFDFCDDGTFELGIKDKKITFEELERILFRSDPTCKECGRPL